VCDQYECGTEAVLQDCAGLSLDDLCDRVLGRLFLPDAEDDVAILAVRLFPEDGPPPPTRGTGS